MDLQSTSIVIVASLLILSKFLDAWSTHRKATSPSWETNPLVRPLMERWGVGRTSWFIFAFTVVYVSLLSFGAWLTTPWSLFLFVPAGLLVALVQGAVAHHNLTGSQNFIVRASYRLMAFLSRLLGR